MNIDIEKLKSSKVTIPIVSIIGAALVIWNLSGQFTEFRDSVATKDNISEVQEQHDDDFDDINTRMNGLDKRMTVVEILAQLSTGVSVSIEREGPKPPRLGPELPPEEESPE